MLNRLHLNYNKKVVQTLKYFSPHMSLTLMLKCTLLQHPSFYIQQNKTFLNMLPVTSKLISLRPAPGGTDSNFHRRKEYRKSSKLLKLMGDLRKEENYTTLFGLKKNMINKFLFRQQNWKTVENLHLIFFSCSYLC